MVASEKTKPVVFISHSGDENVVRMLIEHLTDCETIVSDLRDEAGGNVIAKVKGDIRRADLIIPVLTELSLKSHWVHQEIGFALGIDKEILPVFQRRGDKELPAMLLGLEYESYDDAAVAESAIRIITRATTLLKRQLEISFDTYWAYRNWWLTVDEKDYTSELCYWATPHDLWSWTMPHVEEEQRDVRYRTLIRGDLDFDRRTVENFYEPDEVVFGVKDLAAFQEISIFGNLTVETRWELSFQEKLNEFLSKENPSGERIIQWFHAISFENIKFHVRLNMKPKEAADQRRTLDALFSRSQRP